MPGNRIAKPTERRAGLYLRELQMLQRQGVETIPSSTLGAILGFSDAQVRRDMAELGMAGKPGCGYQVASMVETLQARFGIDRTWMVSIIGVGNLCRALAGHQGFWRQSFRCVAAFDRDPKLIGGKISGVPIHGIDQLEEILMKTATELAILAVPAVDATSIADRIAKTQVSGILNFSPVTLHPSRSGLEIVQVDVSLEMQRLAFAVVNASPNR
ncbi:MAG: redox-sensing transcriptional repressor Rex [Pirellulaceae bacterium]|jgi:redox-sensing transcriptional repressor